MALQNILYALVASIAIMLLVTLFSLFMGIEYNPLLSVVGFIVIFFLAYGLIEGG